MSRRRLALLPRVGQPAMPVVVTLGTEQRRGQEPDDSLVQHWLAKVDARGTNPQDYSCSGVSSWADPVREEGERGNGPRQRKEDP